MDAFEKEFPELLQNMTHSGGKSLDKKQLAKLEQLIGSSSKHSKQGYQQIMRHLEKKHAEVRLSALLICNHLVRQNKAFRKLLIGEDMTRFIELTLGNDKSNPLPPPKNVAKELHNRAVAFIYEWHSEFGKSHMELANAYYFLKDCLKVDFKSYERQKSAEKLKAQMKQRKAEAEKEEKLKKALREFKNYFDEVQSLCTELQNCISLLLPTPEDFFLPLEGSGSSKAASSSESSLRAHGIVTAGTSIPIQINKSIPKVKINDDNQPIIETARDLHSQLANQHSKRVALWTEAFREQSDHAAKYQTCKSLQEQMTRCLDQYKELGLKTKRRLKSESSDSDDFEEVNHKEGYEERVKDELLANLIASKAARASTPEEPKKPIDVPLKKIKIVPTAEPKEKVSTSIEDWEKKNLALPPVIVGIRPDNSQVWIGVSVDETEDVKGPEIQSCPVEISTEFEPVKWSCRAPMPNGSLCPRRDRVKCPFHGKIVPRDEAGQFVREEDAKADQLRKERHMQEHPDWQDPKLLAELKRTTGFDLEIPKKGQRKKKPPEFPGLTDIKAKKDSPRKRLARKILSRSEMRQLTAKLEIEPEEVRQREFYLDEDSDD